MSPESEQVKKAILTIAAALFLPWSVLAILALGVLWIRKVTFSIEL